MRCSAYSVHSRCGPHGRWITLGDPLHRSASNDVVTSIIRSDCYRLERQFAGRDSHPLRDGAFPRHTVRNQEAEWLPGARGANPRFVVTSLGQDRSGTRTVYEELYCARGDMENRIKEQQLDLFADRTSTATMRANQLRLYFCAFAGIVLQIIRQFGLAGTDLAAAQCGTIRVKLLKIAGVVKVTARKVWVSFSSVYPCPERFARIVARLQALARASPG